MDKDNEKKKDLEEDMDVVHASKSNVVAKPFNVEEFEGKVEAKKLTKKERQELIEDNEIGDFDD